MKTIEDRAEALRRSRLQRSQFYELRRQQLSFGSVSSVFDNVDKDVFHHILKETRDLECTTVAEYLRELILEKYFDQQPTTTTNDQTKPQS
tara:strand:- start:4877 stop:5149 length:273 start_codon:yes stop_codon:yes gene_type:complete